MSKLSLKQAAEFAGTTKPTILKHMAKGRVSGEKDEQGQWWFDVSELVRAYGEPGSKNTQLYSRNAPFPAMETPPNGATPSLAAVQARLEAFEQERERERRDKDATIADLRARLDASEEERRRKDAQLTALLTNLPKSPEVTSPPPPPRSWLKRLLRS